MEKSNLKELRLGIDDAGRGPVIGPMILGGCLIPEETETEFKELGITDSKLLYRKKREKLAKIIKEKSIVYYTHSISPAEIDTGMGIGLNLNEVEALAASIVIKELIKNISKEELKNLSIIIDCPSVNNDSWHKNVLEYLENKDLNIRCEHKADLDHVVVAAASIIAKVTRDNEIEKLKKQIGLDFGSGYPADPKTKDFLKKHVNDFKDIHLFRESWATFQKAKENFKLRQSKLPDY